MTYKKLISSVLIGGYFLILMMGFSFGVGNVFAAASDVVGGTASGGGASTGAAGAATATGSNTGAQAAKEAATLATSPTECGSQNITDKNGKLVPMTPRNCLFLEEPIGGKEGYDLYLKTCERTTENQKINEICKITLWRGGAIPSKSVSPIKDKSTGKEAGLKETIYYGPLQAVITETPGQQTGPMALLYNYVGLVYNYVSGLIVGVAVLLTVIAGIQMTVSGGDEAKVTEAKGRIQKAVLGLILWFTASLILYIINPTFFSF